MNIQELFNDLEDICRLIAEGGSGLEYNDSWMQPHKLSEQEKEYKLKKALAMAESLKEKLNVRLHLS